MCWKDSLTLSHVIAGRPDETEKLLPIAIDIGDALDAAQLRRNRALRHQTWKCFRHAARSRQDTRLRPGEGDGPDHRVQQRCGNHCRLGRPALDQPRSDVGNGQLHVVGTGKAKDLDARTHLFSFGAVLYEMATGKLPFELFSHWAL